MSNVDKAMINKLRMAQCSSCSCLTKTPEVSWHDEACLYRVLSEAITALTAAPAEDVRAVVEEPVAYLRQDDSAHNNLVVCAFTDPGAFKVYRGPQRPVVAEPETLFQKGQRLAKEGHGLSNLWGNCAKDSDMDEVQRGMEAYWQSEREKK